MKRKYTILLFIILLAELQAKPETNEPLPVTSPASVIESAGNAPVIIIPDITVLPDETINIPLTVNNFKNIGAVSLTMHYDPAALSYLSYTNTSGFPGLIVYSANPGTMVIAGFNLLPDGFSLNDGSVLFTLTFYHIEGGSSLTWFDNGSSCEFAGPTPNYPTLNDIPACLFYQNGSVNISNQSLSGKVLIYSYASLGVPAEGSVVELRNANGHAVASTLTNADGKYEFGSIPDGTTYLHVSSPISWVGVNATDALAIEKKTIGHQLNFWYPETFINQVADVNNSGNPNSTDALAVLQRTVQIISSFNRGDWTFYAFGMNFENTEPSGGQTIFSGQSQINVLARCTGDVNGSINSQKKSTAHKSVVSDSIIEKETGSLFQVPVALKSDQPIGAISLNIKYDERCIVLHEIRSPIPGLMHHVQNGLLRIAWRQSQEQIPLSLGGNIITFTAELISSTSPGSNLFTISSGTEFADNKCRILEEVSVCIPEILTPKNNDIQIKEELISVHCFPNPCADALNVNYTLHNDAHVEAYIRNIHGEIMATKDLGLLNQGQHHLKLNLKEFLLNRGIYQIDFIATGQNHVSSKYERIVFHIK